MLLNIIIVIFLIALAVFLLLLEIFLLPGITIAGIGGALFGLAGIIFAYAIGTMFGHVTLGISVVLFAGLFFWLLRSKSFNRVALKTNVDSTLTSVRNMGLEVGEEGITTSRLAPIGKARFNNLTVEAKSTGEFIDVGVVVVIVRIEGYNAIVKVKESNHTNESIITEP